MRVSDAMTAEVLTVPPDTSLMEAAQLMRDSDLGPLPVCDRDGRVMGVLTDRDITIRATALGKDPRVTPVESVMTPEAVCCLETDDVTRAAELMQSAQLRRLLVVAADGRLAGIVSLGDLALQESGDALIGQTLERVSEPPANR